MSDSAPEFAVKRGRMVEEQLVARGLRDERVLAAMRTVPRHLFVPPELVAEAYADTPLPIGLGQTISQPYMVAVMTELVGVGARTRILEVGAGSGYQSAVLAELAAEVWALELLAPLAERARTTLARLGYGNVHTAIGDGARGWPEEAPFHGILVAAAAEKVPPALLAQLADGGRLVIPLGHPRQNQMLMVYRREGDTFRETSETGCRFVPLVSHAAENAGGAGAEPWPPSRRPQGGGMSLGEAGRMKAVRARVSGRVQGVYYRASARAEGRRLGLQGWVRNTSDGAVLLHLQGAGLAVDAMLDWCSVGPAAARVSRVEVGDAARDETLQGFEVR